MAVVGMAGDSVSREGETRASSALSQPRLTGTGASRVFSNPWPEWQVCALVEAVITVRTTVRTPAIADPQASCRRLQDPPFATLLKFIWARRSHNTATGKLLDHLNPTPADLARAFPLAPPNYTALANPVGEEYNSCS